MSPPERPPSQNIAFRYGASTTFSKSGRFIQGNEGYQIGSFVVGPPWRPETRRRLPPGGGPTCLKICSTNHFLSQSRCVAGPRFVSKLVQIDTASLLGPPLAASNTSKVASGEGGPNVSKIVQKNTFLADLGVLLAQTFGEN